MTTHPPLLIACCPGRTVAAVKAQLVRAAEAGADLGEVRLDRFSPDERQRLESLFPAPIPLVATLRSRTEGGEGPDAFHERAPLLEYAARLPFRFLDLERARDGALLEAPEPGPGLTASLIVSSHVAESVSIEEVCRLLELPRPLGAIAKVVLPCDFGRMWAELLPQLSPVGAFEPYVLHTTGPTGPLSRAWARRLGMFAVYGALPASTPSADIDTVEPAQLPVDRLRRYEDHGGMGHLFAVVGHPIQHSRSPDIHSFWFEKEKRNGLYLALDMANAEYLVASVGPLASGGFRGLNVTHPWKQMALRLASRVTPAAELAGCANTLTFDEGGVSAENTDVAAVRRRLSELKESGAWDESPVVVLGSGGAARSALAAATTLGSRGIVVARRAEAAAGLVKQYGSTVGVGSDLTPARLVIHATPAGREGAPNLDLPWAGAIGPSTHVLDFVYAPIHPFLRRRAEEQGASYEDGSRLLVYQAAESYALWWGSAPSASLQEAALREVLCAE
ncbi:MAG: type I 3-dehydroquinate dehydratase [Thermoplasmata archaeon]|nr:type I 3-dehydroquinate dehydratase [Thermoplasmata archaeon]